jgi:hypothetical protein
MLINKNIKLKIIKKTTKIAKHKQVKDHKVSIKTLKVNYHSPI